MEIQRVVLAGGKRLRPLLCILAYSAFGGAHAAIYDVACSLELLHASLLIHDDIMDRDYVRHGQPNIAGGYLAHYQDRQSAQHLADSTAILAGDLLLAMAYETVSASGFEAELLPAVTALMGTSVYEVVAGQLLDVASANAFEEDNSLKIAEYKTASYSFIGPLCIGAQLAGASEQELRHMRQFGTALGIGFQLADDLLGLFGDEQKTGKPVTSDMREGKATYLMQAAFRSAEGADKAFLSSHWGNEESTEADLAEVKAIVTRCRARQATEDMLDHYAASARKELSGLHLQADYLTELDKLVDQAMKRQS